MQLSGSNVTPGQVIPTAQIPNLLVHADVECQRSGYASFTFSGGMKAPAFDPTPNTITFNVTAVNDPPVIAFTSGDTTANEGQTKTYTFSITDPDSTTFTWESGYPSCGSSGTVFGTPTLGATSGSFQCSFADDAPTGTASDASTVQRQDPRCDGPVERDHARRHGQQRRPDAWWSAGRARWTRRRRCARTPSTRRDPGAPDTFTPRAGLVRGLGLLVGTVTFNTATGDGSFDCRFADDNPTGTASDTSDGLASPSPTTTLGADEGSKDVTVNNVAPTRRRQRAEPGGRGAGAAHVHLRHERPGGARHLHRRARPRLRGLGRARRAPLTFNTATGDGSFDCRFADDNPTGTASDTSDVSHHGLRRRHRRGRRAPRT